eukprot:6336797-Ditylum_brightwellii.AAC.1
MNGVGVSILPFIQHQKTHDDLRLEIDTFTDNGEESQGIVILGIPIGSKDFIKTSLHSFTSTLHEDSLQIINEFDNLQSVGQLCGGACIAAN